MSDFIQSDGPSDLWRKILKLQWSFLETEEGKQKIEERLKLEGCLKEFLCVVPHDRKFFLPETAYVLRQTIRDMDDFSATKGIIGFGTVSQYANILFTKPWRKEFRVLKIYSGSFQHDIKSNLLHAVKLFEAMGYHRLNEETLIIDGPICPDQVTNVSRDAMAAYVECRIMKQIQMGLAALDLKCSLWDIFNYREKSIGGILIAVKDLSYAIQDRRHRKEKFFNENSYSTIQHLSNAVPPPVPHPPSMVNQCQICMPYYNNLRATQQQQQQCSIQNNQLQSNCAVHQTNGKLNWHCQATQMSHSRSLEHYNETPPLMPQRHSFDHQQPGCTGHYRPHYLIPRAHASYAQHLYESPYDCIDGCDDSLEGSSTSYAAVTALKNTQTAAHPYNVSGNRYPLPYNIMSQLNTHYSTPSTTVTCNGVKGTDPYRTDSFESMYATVSKSSPNWTQDLQQSKMPTNSSKDCRNYQQRLFPPEQLIDFDDRALLTLHDYHAHQHSQLNEFYGDNIDDRVEREYKQHNKSQRCQSHANGLNPMYAEPKDILCQQHASPNDVDVYDSGLYARPTQRRLKDDLISAPQNKHLTDKYIRKNENLQGYDDNNRKMALELNYRGQQENTFMDLKRNLPMNHTNEYDDYESTTLDDFVTLNQSDQSPTQASKNQDGVGSFESWNYVFQNLERSGYSKDLGERGDLLVQSLDLDAMNLGAGNQSQSVEKRNSVSQNPEAKTTNATKQLNAEKSRTLEKLTTTEKREPTTLKKEKLSILKQTTTTINGVNRNVKSSLKQQTPNNLNVDHSKTNGNVMNNDRNITRQISTSTSNGNSGISSGSNNKAKIWSARSKLIPVASQVVVSSSNEWSCEFCTFLNPETKRICEMCCRSKDFNLDGSVSNTPTCV